MRHVRVVHLLLLAALALTGLSFASTASAAAPPCADLQITGISTSPTQPVQGLPATVSVTVKNAGDCDAGGFVLQWRSDTFAPTGPSEAIDSLAAGASRTVTFTYSFPNAGNVTSFANVDTGNGVPETNENNNLEIHPVTVAPQQIDLKVLDVTRIPTPPVATRATTVQIRVKNEGNAPAGAFRVDWSPALFTPGLSRQLDGLGVNETTTVEFSYTYPRAGTFTTNASVDSTGTVAETNEFNNTLWEDVVVDPPLPNLTIGDIIVNPQENPRVAATGVTVDKTPIAGQKTTVRVTVTNNGHNPAGDFHVRYTPHWFASPLIDTVNGLDEGESKVVTFTYTFPSSGHVDGDIKVDSSGAIDEVHEDDNSADVPLDVEQATRDLVVDSLTVSPSAPTQGAQSTFTARVTNTGNSPAGPFVVEVNPDAFGVITPSVKTVSKQVDELGPGESVDVGLPFTYPQKGNFRAVAKADAFDAVKETNEANNLKILNVTVQRAPVDLVITDFTITPSQPVRGERTQASITVKNNGPVDTEDFFVTWKPTSDAWFPQHGYTQGLHPGQSKTLTFQDTYWGTGTFTSVAQVDTFNMVEEPGAGESNNTQNRSVTVVPPSTTLDVRLDHLLALNDMDDGPLGTNKEGEWNPILFAVFDPKATCHVDIDRGPLEFKQDIPMVACTTTSDNSVQDDDKDKKTVTTNKTLRVTLEDVTPLVTAVGVLEDDDPLAPDVPGYAYLIKFKPDYLFNGLQQVAGEGCSKISATGSVSEANGGHCFDAFFGVTKVGSVGSSALTSSRVVDAAATTAASSTASLATKKLAAQRKLYLSTALKKLRSKYSAASRKAAKGKKGQKASQRKLRVRAMTSRVR